MDLEAPADAWYVWFGVVLVTVAFAGVALSLPTQPAPDATEAANTIDEVAASSVDASATYEHDASRVRIAEKQIWLRNSGGTARATIAFGTMTPVREHPDNPEPGLNILIRDADPASEFDSAEKMVEWATEARKASRGTKSEWQKDNGQLRVKKVMWGDKSVLFVDA